MLAVTVLYQCTRQSQPKQSRGLMLIVVQKFVQINVVIFVVLVNDTDGDGGGLRMRYTGWAKNLTLFSTTSIYCHINCKIPYINTVKTILKCAINYSQFECAHLFENIFIILSEPQRLSTRRLCIKQSTLSTRRALHVKISTCRASTCRNKKSELMLMRRATASV